MKTKTILTSGVAFAAAYIAIIASLNYFKGQPVIPTPIVIEKHQSTTFEATGYAIGDPYSTITKSGQPVINRSFMQIGGIDIFTIAVDPKVIPLGSLVYIDSLGIALATDTGKKIRGRLIDICFTNMDEATEWGRRDVRVYVLKRGPSKKQEE